MKMGFVAGVSSLTDRYQTTVPEAVRRALDLGKRDKIRFVEQDGRIYLERVDPVDADPALAPFLTLIEADLAARPEAIRPLTAGQLAEIDALIGEEDIDLGAALRPDED
ncbi:MAG TPA: type II toxin-antitoxin system PrlF family antitoxin [Amaricoccus sp.]|uniref:type II toxin-antitoxin system PrlF family antitoxin n=1 Tax=Amaricoccus sp. TaxID=1872485 RepID=UPI002BE3F31A|nr:type II toxin-antitoxin system PrlF family antitoxin [Amaricoccus sp.]HRO13377.1 type II toxin-antitoxin system PrlF family antitoxin [Amaricoccus sp.]